MVEKAKKFWYSLNSRTKKIIKTFFEAGIAYILTSFASSAVGLDKESVKILIVSAIAAGISAVMNLNDKE